MANFERNCTYYVRAKEETDLEEMCYEALRKTHRAEGCGCPSCIKQATAAQERFVDESWRVNVWQPDQEEEVLQELALAKLNRAREGK